MLAAISWSPAPSLAVESGAVGMLVGLEVGGLLQKVKLTIYQQLFFFHSLYAPC